MQAKTSLKNSGIRIPVFITRHGKWFVATAPQLDLVTKGETFEEAKENMKDLLSEYFKDPDTVKPNTEDLMVFDIAFIPVSVPEGVSHSKAQVFG